MKITAIIASRTPELAQLAVDSLRTFAPAVRPVVVNTSTYHFPIWGAPAVQVPTPIDGAPAHPLAIEYARMERLHAGAELVMLMDDDAMITSPNWYKVVTGYFERHEKLSVLGGRWLWDDEHQATYRGWVVPHAHMLVMRRHIFDGVASFAPPIRRAALEAQGDVDTAFECSWLAIDRGEEVQAMPYRGHANFNRIFTGLRVQEYFNGDDDCDTLWAHVGRGTSWAHQGMLREAVRRVTALWSPRSQKILRRRAAKDAYIVRGREWLLGGVR